MNNHFVWRQNLKSSQESSYTLHPMFLTNNYRYFMHTIIYNFLFVCQTCVMVLYKLSYHATITSYWLRSDIDDNEPQSCVIEITCIRPSRPIQATFWLPFGHHLWSRTCSFRRWQKNPVKIHSKETYIWKVLKNISGGAGEIILYMYIELHDLTLQHLSVHI